MSEKDLPNLEAGRNEIRRSWETRFTNPQNHDQNNFTYLVHAISPVSRLVWIERLGVSDAYDSSQDINLLIEPGGIAERKIILASVIDQRHRRTYNDASGLILKTPFENILSVEVKDPGIEMALPDAETPVSTRPVAVTVDQLIKATSPSFINVLTLTGETEAGKLEIAGVFVKTVKGAARDKTVAGLLEQTAHELNVPVIYIEEMGFEDKVEALVKKGKTWGIATNREGKRFIWDFNGEFTMVDEEGRGRQMSDKEFEYFKEVMDKELDPEMREKYGKNLEDLTEAYKRYIDFINKLKQ